MSVTVDVDAGGSVTVDVDENAGGPAGGVLSGNYPDPGFAVPMATEAELTAHEAAHPAHPASGVSVASGAGVTATDVQAAIAQIVGFITSQEAGDSAAIAAVAASVTDEIARATAAEAAKQAHDADLDTIAALDSTVAGALATDGAGWIRKTYAQLKTALSLVKGDVGLGNVDNTSDANKPVSTAQAAADATKLVAGSTATYANLAALPAASAHTNEIHKTLDGGVYESTGSAWVQLVAPNGTYALPLVRTAVKTANYTAVAQDLVPVDTTSGAVTVTLPNAPTDKSMVCVKHIIQGGTNAVTIACAGADVFNRAGGGTTATLPYANQAMLLEYTASGGIWSVIADDLPLSQLDLRFAPITGIAESAVTSLVSDLAAKATDATVVHNTGAETVAGVKTFSASPVVPDGSFTEAKVTGLVADLAAKVAATGPTADLPFNSHKATGLADPTSAQDAATKAYVDAFNQGFDLKASVRAASNTNHNTASPGATVDGVTLAAGDRVLLRAQTTASQNGIYVWNGASSAMTRATDADTSAKVTSGLYTFATEGTAWGSTGFGLITADPITLGTTALTFTPVAGVGEVVAGTGLSKTGNTLAVSDAELLALAGLTSAADQLPYFTGAGSASLATLSAFIRTLLDDADAATALATLGAPTGGLFKIAETDLSSSAASIDLTSIPGTYLHLLLVVHSRSDRAANTSDNLVVSLNNDTTDANYDRQRMTANAATSSASETLAASGSRLLNVMPAASSPANAFGAHEILIPNYADTARNKLILSKSFSWGARSTGTLNVGMVCVGWASTAAVNRVTFTPSLGTNLVAGTKVSLYGIAAGA